MTLVERVARELWKWLRCNDDASGWRYATDESRVDCRREARRIVKMFQEDSVITRFRKLKSGKLVLKEGKA